MSSWGEQVGRAQLGEQCCVVVVVVAAVVAAYFLLAGVVLAVVVAKSTACVVTVGSGQLQLLSVMVERKGQPVRVYLHQTLACRRQQTPGGLKSTAVMASAPRLVARAVIGDVAGGSDMRPLEVGAVNRKPGQHSTMGSREAGPGGSRPGVVDVGRPRALSRCRAPCWRAALRRRM